MQKNDSILILTCLLVLTILMPACSPGIPPTPGAPTESEFPVVGTPSLQPTNTVTSPVESLPKVDLTAPLALTAFPDLPPFSTQIGSPVAIANFVSPQSGCNWMGVGGQVFDLNGTPLTRLVIEVGGDLEGRDIFHLALSGNEPILGPGGFLVVLSDHALNTSGQLWILVYDLAGQPLIRRTYFPTFSDCTKNFTLINFKQRSPAMAIRMTLPLVYK
jgi:hypothetical protein